MLEKILQQVDIIIEMIRGEDPVLNQLLIDDFEYSYSSNLNPKLIYQTFLEREKQAKEQKAKEETK